MSNRMRAYIRESSSSLRNENFDLPARLGSPRSLASSAQLTIADGLVLADATTETITLTLPEITNKGIMITIKKIDSTGNFVNLTGFGSETIDNSLSASIGQQYEAVTVVEDGIGWWIV